MKGKFFLAWVVAFVVWMAGSFLVHGVILHGDYAMLRNLFRTETEAQAKFPLMVLAHILIAGSFVWIYSRGIEAKPWLSQGFRYGIAVALLTAVPMYTIYYVVQPMPGALAVKQMIFEGILTVIVGIVTAWVYRGETARA
jgi:hypothetical protein